MFFLDVQGTLISDADKSLIYGAKELIDFLNMKNIPYVVITNNTKKIDFLERLRQKGL
ncbi:HAD family hydrolase, partial [Campylobacter coli]|nr:HAD family hydrolase [Campylobacter coli]